MAMIHGKDSQMSNRPSMTRSWLVAGSCSWINLFIFSVFRSAGVLYRSLVETYGCTYAEASWPITLASGVSAVTCLPAGFMSHYLDKRTIVTTGVLVLSFSISICYFAQSITFVIVSLGIFQGIGIGLVTVLLPSIINDHFGQQRAAAVGLSYSGATVGAFVFPLLFQYLVDTFKLHNCLLIMGGIALCGLCGAIMLLKPKAGHCPSATSGDYQAVVSNCSSDLVSDQVDRPVAGGCDKDNVMIDGTAKQLNGSIHIQANSNLMLRDEEDSHFYEHEDEDRSSNAKYNELKNGNQEKQKMSQDVTKSSEHCSNKVTLRSHLTRDAKLLINPHFALISLTYVTFIISNVTFLMVIVDYAMDCGIDRKRSVLLLSLYSITDLMGRLIPGWLSYCKVLSNKSIYILSITLLGTVLFLFPISMSSTTNRLLVAVATETYAVNVTSMVLSEIPVIVDANWNFTIFLVLTLLMGFAAGCQMILPPVVITEYMGSANTAVAFGLTNFICGLLSFSRPFLIGYVKDRTNRYDDVFYFLGSFAFISSTCWLLDCLCSKVRISATKVRVCSQSIVQS